MRFATFATGALACVLTSAALAADPAVAPVTTPALDCDFFEAQIIGVLCGRTAYVGGDFQAPSISLTNTGPVFAQR